MTTVVRLPVRGRWAWDVRGEGRAVRISAHVESGLVNLSVWRYDTCVGTVRLLPSEVAGLVSGLTESLAWMTVPPAAPQSPAPAGAERLRGLEHRLARLEAQQAAPLRRTALPAVAARLRSALRRPGT